MASPALRPSTVPPCAFMMEMPLPENTLPMMSGQGPYGAIEMGGMFTTVKVRAGLKANDYMDPGWYKPAPGTTAYEWTGHLVEPARAPKAANQSSPAKDVEMTVRKPSGHSGH